MHPLLEQEELDFIFELYRPTTSTKPVSEQSQNRNYKKVTQRQCNKDNSTSNYLI